MRRNKNFTQNKKDWTTSLFSLAIALHAIAVTVT